MFPEVGELVEAHPGADPLEPLDELADALVRAVDEQQVDMVACDLTGENRQFVFHGNLTEQVTHPEGHGSHEDWFPVLRDPDEVELEIMLAVRSTPVAWHAPILPHPRTRLKARVFDHP